MTLSVTTHCIAPMNLTSIVPLTPSLCHCARPAITDVGINDRAARSPVFYGSSRISGYFSRLPFETNTGDTFSRISTSLNFVA